MLVQQPNPGVEIGEVQILLAHQHLFQVADEAHDLVIVGQDLLETAPDLSQLRGRGIGPLFAAEKIKQTHILSWWNLPQLSPCTIILFSAKVSY